MQLKTITDQLENWAPLAWQESYDNAGLILGDPLAKVESALICLDLNEKIVLEAIEKKAGLIISHHPPIFQGIKKINTSLGIGKCIKLSIEHNIAWYCMHTNLDNSILGVNQILAQKLNLQNTLILKGKSGLFKKLSFYCPISKTSEILEEIYKVGGGKIGNYEECSFCSNGKGSFKPLDNANPYVGFCNTKHIEDENKVEILFPTQKEAAVTKALFSSHPYEDVAYEILSIDNESNQIGAGKIGELQNEMSLRDFLSLLKEKTNCQGIRHSASELDKKIKKIAICGGSGSFLIKDAKQFKADVYLTGDLKYHDYEQASSDFILVDIGHYESEQFTKDLIYEYISEKFPTFAILISEYCTNPIHIFK